MMLKTNQWTLQCAILSAFLFAELNASAQVTAYPAKGQSAEQQQMDKAACQDFAKSQTGFDPQQAMAASAAPSATTPPPAVRARKRAREEQQELSQQNQQKAQMNQKLQAYNKAESVCLQGRGYSVS